MSKRQHWEQVYQTKAPDAVSWYAPHLYQSLSFIERIAGKSDRIIDVGGGESTLVDDLLERGYEHVSVLDISQAAIDGTRRRLGAKASDVQWITGDITQVALPVQYFDVWHDRAVFHFLTSPEQRQAYVRQVSQAMKPGGHIIVATFGPQGPEKCSGLEVVRYDADALHEQFGTRFRRVDSTIELHETPFGTTQQFLYCYCKIE